MSWSVSFIGKPKNVMKALQDYSNDLRDQSKVEYDSALPHLIGLVAENFSKEGSGYNETTIHLDASGSGTAKGEEQIHRSLSVTLRGMYTKLV